MEVLFPLARSLKFLCSFLRTFRTRLTVFCHTKLKHTHSMWLWASTILHLHYGSGNWSTAYRAFRLSNTFFMMP